MVDYIDYLIGSLLLLSAAGLVAIFKLHDEIVWVRNNRIRELKLKLYSLESRVQSLEQRLFSLEQENIDFKVLALKGQGFSVDEIASNLGLPKMSVSSRLARLAEDPNYKVPIGELESLKT